MTLKQLRDRLNEIDPKFDDYTVGIYYSDSDIEDDILVDFPKDPVLCPTPDKERQGMFMAIGRREWDKMVAKLEEYGKKED